MSPVVAPATAPAIPQRMHALLDALTTLQRELDLDRLLALIMEKASVVVEADRSTLFLVDAGRQELWSKVAQGVERREIRIPIGQGIAGAVAATGEIVNIADAYRDPRFNPEVDKQTGYRTETILCLPVRERDGTIVAVLQVLNRAGGPFTAADQDLLQAFASQVAIAIRNAEQVEQIERRRRTSDILLTVMKSFSAELDVDALLRKIMALTSEVMNAERSTLFVVDARRRQLWSRVAQGAEMTEIRLPLGHGIAGTVAATGEVINIASAYEDARFDRTVDEKTGYTTRTILCAPVRNAEGAVVGVAQVLNKHAGPFSREDEELLSALAAQAFIALDNARLFETVLNLKNYNESILQCMATGVMAVDSDRQVTSANPACRRIFGLPEALPGRARVDDVLERRGNEPLVGELLRCARDGSEYTGYDLRYALPSGEAVSLNLSVVPLRDRKGHSLGIVVVAEDITHEQRLMNTLCRYVTREIAEHVLKDKDKLRLGGHRQEVSILFSDIRNFTTISEAHDAEEIVTLLNDYFSLMVQEIFGEQGTLDKFIGDAVMAVFGAPIQRADDPVRAVRAALGMRRALKRFNERQAQRGKLTLQTGIGISHGEVISGNVGSEQRMEYTVIGDPVNLASRLEELTKTSGYKVLISDVTFEQVKDVFDCAFVGEHRIKGLSRAVRIYGLADPKD